MMHLVTDILIGLLADNKNITPASPKDVAKAIAEARCKLAASQMEPPHQDEDSGNTDAVTVKAQLALQCMTNCFRSDYIRPMIHLCLKNLL